jgi:hypothetical protein
MKTTRIVLAAIAVLTVTYVATNFYIGHRLERETGILAQSLASRPDARVTRLEYDRGFRKGILHYDVTWLPETDDGISAEGIRFAGTLDFRHGPWVGGQAGFALAASEGGITLPEPWRQYLPEYPGEAPALRLAAVVTPGGDLEARVVATDYVGPIAAPDFNGIIRLGLTGLEGTLRTNSRLDRLALDARLGEFTLGLEGDDQAAGIAARGLAVKLDAREARRWLWTGATRISLDELGIHTLQQQFEMHEVSTVTQTGVDAGRLHSTNTAAFGAARLDGDRVLGGGLDISLRGIDADALSALVGEGHRQAAMMRELGEDASEAGNIAWARPYLEQILSARPSMAVDRLALSLAAPDDVMARLEIGLSGDEPLSFDRPEALAGALQVAAQFRISKLALRHVAGVMSERQLPVGTSDAELAAAAESQYQDALAGMQLLPFLVVGEHDISAQAALREGRVLVGDSEVMDIGALLAVALAGMF